MPKGSEAPRPSVNYPFRDWCRAKGFSPQHGYKLIQRGELAVFKIGRYTMVSEDEDRAFDERTRGATQLGPAFRRSGEQV